MELLSRLYKFLLSIRDNNLSSREQLVIKSLLSDINKTIPEENMYRSTKMSKFANMLEKIKERGKNIKNKQKTFAEKLERIRDNYPSNYRPCPVKQATEDMMQKHRTIKKNADDYMQESYNNGDVVKKPASPKVATPKQKKSFHNFMENWIERESENLSEVEFDMKPGIVYDMDLNTLVSKGFIESPNILGGSKQAEFLYRDGTKLLMRSRLSGAMFVCSPDCIISPTGAAMV